jgi:hypothetical protein
MRGTADPEFDPKMAEILCVYRQVAMLRGHADNVQDQDNSGSLAIVSYDGSSACLPRRRLRKAMASRSAIQVRTCERPET